jgi:hypothetical protein
MNVILTVVVTCSLMLTVQHSILAQVKSKQESPRAMLQRLQQEIEGLEDKIAENPSSSKVGEMKSKIQWNMRKIKEMAPRIGEQTERKIKAKGDIESERTQTSGEDRYRAIIQNNLFMPLGSGGEAKREEFALIGTMGRSALIQMVGSDKSSYVAEGQSFGNDAKLVRVGENSVTIFHEGSKKELELASIAPISQGGGAKGGRNRQRQGNSGKSGREMGSANRAEKERWSEAEKERRDGGEKQRGDTNWARNMSMDELSRVRGEIGRYIEGLRAKGVRDPEAYEGAYKKMEAVEDAMAERGDSK